MFSTSLSFSLSEITRLLKLTTGSPRLDMMLMLSPVMPRRTAFSSTSVLVLGSRTFASRIDLSTLPPIMVEGITIPFVNEVRNLGVIMNANLSWRNHVMSISKKVHFSLHKLKFHRNALSRELRTTLIVSLIFSLIDYCCLVFNDLTNEVNTKLQQLVNCGIRFIFDLRQDVHISPYRRSLGWLSVKSRRLYFLGCATFNII